MLENYKKTIKSTETEDWLDLHVVRPVCYLLACLFAKLDIHPNTVTIASMFVGAGSTYFFISGSWYYSGVEGLVNNLIAIAMLIFADLLDCTDGQLARMTGKKSPLGRILDGIAGFTWFVPIYHGLIYRFYLHHDIEFGWFGIENTEQNTLIATAIVYLFGLYAGFSGTGGQQRLADYYIQVHLFFIKGEKGSELDSSLTQQEKYDQMPWKGHLIEKCFQKSYVGYTQKQEKSTPEFQNMLRKLMDKYGSIDKVPTELREEIRRKSLKIIPFNGMLTFNFRTLILIVAVLCDVPAMNFIGEAVGMGLFAMWINHKHESFCKEIAAKI